MIEAVEEILKEKVSLEREYLELIHISDEMSLPAEIHEKMIMANIAHSLSVIADTLADRKTEPKQEWIPCSDRLPSDGQCVIIQYYDTTGKNHVSVVGAYYNARQGFVDTGYGGMWFGNGNDDVIAWLPLPKPYTGEMNDDN